MDSEQFKKLRREYIHRPFTKKNTDPNPFIQFESWFNQAVEQVLDMPNAMTLATVSDDGYPEARLVLLKHYDETGFSFFTNYNSSKGKALDKQKKASLLFYWSVFDRQIRIKGDVERLSKKDSEGYFQSRPIDSQIAAVISPQSQVIENREILENKFVEKKAQLKIRKNLTLPDYWGGYRIKPRQFEFWQGRENRLHDRLRYSKNDNDWTIQRIAP